ncbi:Malic enzyme, hydrogenosomal [Galdieria sulphuraria]|nr:Malic enzyme, hydrogenosomal [Galdieria sulphuraria]
MTWWNICRNAKQSTKYSQLLSIFSTEDYIVQYVPKRRSHFISTEDAFGRQDSQQEKPKPSVYRTRHRGMEVIQDPFTNRGAAFSWDERERLGIRGLVPPKVQSFDVQAERVLSRVDALHDPLNKYDFLVSLLDRNETLFYRVLTDHFQKIAPIIYTPTVGLASQKSQVIFRRPRGMYFSKYDRGCMNTMVYNWPQDQVDVIVVTDGSRILGLGDLGANGIQIPIGKLALYVAGGGIDPRRVLPVVLDVGTNNEALRKDPWYLGIAEPRITGDEYFRFVDEFMEAVYSRWPQVMVQFEDFANPVAYPLLEMYRDKYLCFNDDIQSTGSIALASILASLRVRGLATKDIVKERIVCMGAEGLRSHQAYRQFWLLDDKGLLGRDGSSLEEVVRIVKPTILLGLSGAGGVFTETAIREMAKHVEKPVIFPLSNPVDHAECTASQAIEWTDGRAIFASGSPFDDVEYQGKIYPINQCNNVYNFPGMGLAVTACRISHITDDMFQAAARRISSLSGEDKERLFLPLSDLRKVSLQVATAVAEVAYEEGLATAEPPRKMTLHQYLLSHMWQPQYAPLVPL